MAGGFEETLDTGEILLESDDVVDQTMGLHRHSIF